MHEQKMNRNSICDEQALKASTFISSNCRGRGRGIGKGDWGNRYGVNKYENRNFRDNEYDYDKGRGRDFDKSKIECYRCHKFEHYSSECHTRLPNEKEEKAILLRIRKEKPCYSGSCWKRARRENYLGFWSIQSSS